MRVVFLKTLVGVTLAYVASTAAERSEQVPPPFPVEQRVASARGAPSPSPAEASAAPESIVREPEQLGLPFLRPREEGEQQASDQGQASQRLVLGALRFETLFNYMTEMQQRFFQAILPDSWAVPKFLPSVNSDLEEVHAFVREIAEASGANSIPAALQELAESGRLPELLQGNFAFPPAFEHLLSASTSTVAHSGSSSNPLARLLPTLNLEDLDVISRLFRVPSELEFPVSPDGLSLFLPVIVRHVSNVAEPLLSGGGTAQDVMASITDILVPVVDHEGQLLFADAASVFQGIELPSELAIRPLALFSAFEDEDVSGLWNAVRAPMLSRLSLLGSDAPALFGPVMTLASLPRVALSLNGESQPATGTSQLARIVGDVSSRLRTALRSFEDLGVSEVIPASTQALMREPLEEFLNMRFLNFSIPVVGLARELEPGALTPLISLSQCTTSDCPLGLSMPSFPEFLVSPDTAIYRLQEEIETLTVQLQAAIQQLQNRINNSLPQGLSGAADAQGVSLDEVLNTTLSLTGTLQNAVGIAGERVNKLLTVESVSPEDLAAFEGFKQPAGLTSKETRASKTRTKTAAVPGARTGTKAEKPTSFAALLQAKQEKAQAAAARRRAGAEGQKAGFTKKAFGTKTTTTTVATEATTATSTAPTAASSTEDGLLAPRRQLQTGLIDLPALGFGGLDLGLLELPGQGSLEQLLSLRQLTSAVEDFVPMEGNPLLSGLSHAKPGRSLGALFKDNMLPENLLQQPLSSLLRDGASSLPSSLNNLNLGQFLSLSSAVDRIFESPLVELPNLATLSLNPSALLSLPQGASAVDKLFAPPATRAAPPPPATAGLFF
ncbi:hypothetical protein Emag_007251 [Eimeria magna]